MDKDGVDPGGEEAGVEDVGLKLGALRDRAAHDRRRRRRKLHTCINYHASCADWELGALGHRAAYDHRGHLICSAANCCRYTGTLLATAAHRVCKLNGLSS